MKQQLFPAFRAMLLLTALTGLLYPALVTGVCQLLFPGPANGSLIKRNGQVIGSALLGQNFAGTQYFHPRPSAAGNDGYDPTASGGSNLGPTNQKLAERVRSAVAQFHKENPAFTGPIPADAVTASASGLDPDISPAYAEAQITRVAEARHLSVSALRKIVNQQTQGAVLGLFGERRVNVLGLNLKLDENFFRH